MSRCRWGEKIGDSQEGRESDRERERERERDNNSKPDTVMAGSCALNKLFLMTTHVIK